MRNQGFFSLFTANFTSVIFQNRLEVLIRAVTSAGILISGAGFAGGYAAAIGSKATSVVRTIVVKGGKQVKLIFKSTGASAAEIAKWTNHFGNIMKTNYPVILGQKRSRCRSNRGIIDSPTPLFTPFCRFR